MRKVGETIGKAFRDGEPASCGNTMTNGNVVFLHGNPIVKREDVPGTNLCHIFINLAGWPTKTTRCRINDILTVIGSTWRVRQRDGEQKLGPGRMLSTIPVRGWIKVQC